MPQPLPARKRCLSKSTSLASLKIKPPAVTVKCWCVARMLQRRTRAGSRRHSLSTEEETIDTKRILPCVLSFVPLCGKSCTMRVQRHGHRNYRHDCRSEADHERADRLQREKRKGKTLQRTLEAVEDRSEENTSELQ